MHMHMIAYKKFSICGKFDKPRRRFYRESVLAQQSDTVCGHLLRRRVVLGIAYRRPVYDLCISPLSFPMCSLYARFVSCRRFFFAFHLCPVRILITRMTVHDTYEDSRH